MKYVFVGLVSAIELNFLGAVYIGELIFFVSFLLGLGRVKIQREQKVAALLILIWVVQQVISDVINEVDLATMLKGVGAPALLLTTWLGIYSWFYDRVESLRFFLVGVFLGFIATNLLSPSLYFYFNPWKWGVGMSLLNIIVVLFFWKVKNRGVASNVQVLLLFSLFSIVSIGFDSRTLAIFPIIAIGTMIFFKSAIGIKVGKRLIGWKALVSLAATILVLNSLLTAVFSSPSILQLLPDATAEKMASQAAGGYGLLLGGRTEILASLDAFLDKPFFGHGSWAEDEDGYQDNLVYRLYELDYLESAYWDFGNNLIPVHSYFMGAVVWAGALAGLFWLYIFKQVVNFLITYSPHLNIYIYLNGVFFLWAILFSPFGGAARWGAEIFLSVLFVVVGAVRRRWCRYD